MSAPLTGRTRDDRSDVAAGITVDSVSKRFRHDRLLVEALDRVSLDVAAGEFVGVIGPSGCGKSTLIRLIGGLAEPDGGSIRVGGMPPAEARAEKLFGLVPQSPSLLPWRSVLDNVTLLRDVGRRTSGWRDPMALLGQVGLAEFASSLPKELSGGMQQRVSLVRAFALGAPVLLMDEPFAALDEITRQQMRYQLLDVWEATRATVVFVTHSIPEAVILSDRVVTMAARPGRVIDVEEISLPRPRHEEMEFEAEFAAHAIGLRRALRSGWA